VRGRSGAGAVTGIVAVEDPGAGACAAAGDPGGSDGAGAAAEDPGSIGAAVGNAAVGEDPAPPLAPQQPRTWRGPVGADGSREEVNHLAAARRLRIGAGEPLLSPRLIRRPAAVQVWVAPIPVRIRTE
jgi:hypothetical protein